MADTAVPTLDDSARPDMRVGLAVAVAFFGLFLGWAALIPLDAGAYAAGVIAVSGNRQAVQHPYGGVVSALHVTEGGHVTQGQVLLEISAGELRANERGLTGQVLALLAMRARLTAERDGRSSIAVPPEFSTLDADDRVLADEAFRLQQLQFRSRGTGLSTQRSVLVARERQLDEQIAGLQEQIASNGRQQALIQDELTGVERLAAQGYAPQTRVRALQRTAEDLSGQQGAFRSQIAGAREAIGQTRLQIAELGATRNEDVNDQIRQAEVQLNELRPRLAAARDQLARALVRSPATGQVVGLKVFTVGGVVPPTETLMEVVPDRALLQMDIRIKPDDADDLRVGQPTEVKFTALRERDLPRLTGRLTSLSADSFADERTGERYFKGTVEVPPEELNKLHAVRGPDLGLRPGLPVQVVIPLRKRTALQYLVEPLGQTFWRSFREH